MKKFIFSLVLISSVFICSSIKAAEKTITKNQYQFMQLIYKAVLTQEEQKIVIAHQSSLNADPRFVDPDHYIWGMRNISRTMHNSLIQKLQEIPQEKAEAFKTKYKKEIEQLKQMSEIKLGNEIKSKL